MRLSSKLLSLVDQKRPKATELTIDQIQRLARIRTLHIGHFSRDDMAFFENFGDHGHRARPETILRCPITVSWDFEKIHSGHIYYMSRLTPQWVNGHEGEACLNGLQQVWYRLNGDVIITPVGETVVITHAPADPLYCLISEIIIV